MRNDQLATSSDFRFLPNYPEARVTAAALVLMNKQERRGFVRAWLSEGVPAAFRDSPMVYEMLRDWLAHRLSALLTITVDPKEITLVGSARLGYSLAPHPRFGRPFGPNSDLDFALVSLPVFEAVIIDFRSWQQDVKQGHTKPRTPREEGFWTHNLQIVEEHISRGFIDPKKIPSRHGYKTVRRINSTMAALINVLTTAPLSLKVRASSVRVYRDWESFVSQVCINLNRTIPRRYDIPRSFFGSGYWDWS